jgi:hypothetical protein
MWRIAAKSWPAKRAGPEKKGFAAESGATEKLNSPDFLHILGMIDP